MRLSSTYSVRIGKEMKVFVDTVRIYREAVDFFIGIMRERPEAVA